MSRADEELQGAEDKLNHLSMVKSKLEQTLDDLEDTLEREKRSKADAEKTMRKMETDMKVQLFVAFCSFFPCSITVFLRDRQRKRFLRSI